MSAPLRLASATVETPQLGDPSGHFWSKSSDHFLADPNLNDSDKVVLQALVSLCRGGLSCQDSNKVIGERCHKEEKTINKVIKRLEDRGIITRIANGPWRTIHLNFSFRGQADYSRASEGVKPQITPAQERTKPRAREDQTPPMRGGNPAHARTIIRLDREEIDSSSEGRSASAGGSLAPPPPTDLESGRAEAKCDGSIIPMGFPMPLAQSLPDEIARYLPRDLPSGIIRPGSKAISRSPSKQMFPMPLTMGDLLKGDEIIHAKLLMNSLDPESSDHNLMRIVIRRHNAAFTQIMTSKILPPGINVREVTRIIDIEPREVRLEAIDTQQAQMTGPVTPLESRHRSRLEVPLDTLQSTMADDQVN